MSARIASICPWCRRIVPARQVCECRPKRQHKPEALRRETEPHRAEYQTAEYQRDRQRVLEQQQGRCATCHAVIADKVDGRWVTRPGGGTHHIGKDYVNRVLVGLCRRCHSRADAN